MRLSLVGSEMCIRGGPTSEGVGVLDRMEGVDFSSKIAHKGLYVGGSDKADQTSGRVEVHREGKDVFTQAAIHLLDPSETCHSSVDVSLIHI